MLTYLEKLQKNSEDFDKLVKKEYATLKIAELKAILKDIKRMYKNDPQELKLFTTGYKEMIKKGF